MTVLRNSPTHLAADPDNRTREEAGLATDYASLLPPITHLGLFPQMKTDISSQRDCGRGLQQHTCKQASKAGLQKSWAAFIHQYKASCAAAHGRVHRHSARAWAANRRSRRVKDGMNYSNRSLCADTGTGKEGQVSYFAASYAQSQCLAAQALTGEADPTPHGGHVLDLERHPAPASTSAPTPLHHHLPLLTCSCPVQTAPPPAPRLPEDKRRNHKGW